MYITSLKKARSQYQSAYCPVFSLKSFSCVLTMDTPTCLCLTSSLVCSELDSLQLSVLSKQCNVENNTSKLQRRSKGKTTNLSNAWPKIRIWNIGFANVLWGENQFNNSDADQGNNVCVCVFQPRFQTKTIFVSFLVTKVFQISHFVQQKAKKSQEILWWFKNKQNKWAVE